MELLQEIAATFAAIKANTPLVHHLTNYVTANDSANITLACGASPVMAADPGEATDMVAKAGALVLNIGTLNAAAVDTMIATGRRAGDLGVPIILDPVGAGATPARTDAAGRIVRETSPAVIRGNAAEIKTVAGLSAAIRGVDSAADEPGGEAVAAGLARRLGCVVALTGRTDIVAGAGRVCRIANGHPWLARVTGTGCMATSLIGCCLGAGASPYAAAVTGLVVMGVAGELAHRSLGPEDGIGTFRVKLFDAVFNLTPELLVSHAKISETRED
ncbi:hydroxyethylthiazole kinase [Anaeroselena agilis]|uniref:Hydroxyethylthiazole kinase n=1 Tax=Anaeroselena agilis TaxID=3063788 RepID=A0ABU3NZ67_9FIRM|nr:hydroxyethylthiazole kinase [Selenomonadales bacterium 4137-cl]